MLYDEHYKLGVVHATLGRSRYLWSDTHLQQAYDRGYHAALKHESQRSAGEPPGRSARCIGCGGIDGGHHHACPVR